MLIRYYFPIAICLLAVSHLRCSQAFEDEINEPETEHKEEGHLPKDKVLLKNVKTLSFYRNKRTTSRRTHAIHQLSCVGGTAGCKLFTPNVVECENAGFDKEKNNYNWRCQADVGDRVRFNHVEVICEGYDYPEDEYILLGSCGLEFTLDYADPHDYHHHSYFKHMDDHEKEMHHEKVRAKTGKEVDHDVGYFRQLQNNISNHILLIGAFLLLSLCSFVIVRYLSSSNNPATPSKRRNPALKGSNYGPLSSAVLTAKKAC